MVFLAFLELAAATVTPSFDCARARSQIEHAICGSVELAELDREEARLYSIALVVPQARKRELVQRQREFLENRDSCTESFGPLGECLRDAYLGDIAELRRVAEIADDNEGLSFGPNRFVCDGGYPDVYVTIFATEPKQGWISIPELNEGQPLVANIEDSERLVGRYAEGMYYDIGKATAHIEQRICTRPE